MRRRAAKGGEGEEMHAEKFTHRNVSVLMHAHTLSNPTHLPAVHRGGARCKRKTSARITSCLRVYVCLCVCVWMREPCLCLGIQGKQASRSERLESVQAIDSPLLNRSRPV